MRKYRVLHIGWSVLTCLYCIVGILIFMTVVMPGLLGYETGIVKSGSMEPAIHTGSMIYYKETEAETIQIGDIIAYRASEAVTVTHRVVGISKEEKTFTTKGDSNASEDISPVSYSQLSGKVQFSLPYAGYFYSYVTMYKIFFIAAAVLMAVGSAIFSRFR